MGTEVEDVIFKYFIYTHKTVSGKLCATEPVGSSKVKMILQEMSILRCLGNKFLSRVLDTEKFARHLFRQSINYCSAIKNYPKIRFYITSTIFVNI